MSTRRKEVDLVNSLIEYVSDIKPYHTKLKNSSSEVFFEESTSIQTSDSHQINIFHQNIWGKSDAGGEYLVKNTDYSFESDLTFRLPATVFPRWSLKDHSVQTPPGEDTPDNMSSYQVGSQQIPVELPFKTSFTITSFSQTGSTYSIVYDIEVEVDLFEHSYYGFGSNYIAKCAGADVTPTVVNANTYKLTAQTLDFTPNAAETAFLSSHSDDTKAKYALNRKAQLLHIYWTDTGRYQVPFHQGSRVRVNEELQEFGVDYFINQSRNFIQFAADSHPPALHNIHFNLMKVDRFFISYVRPFTIGDYFQVVINDAAPGRFEPVTFTAASSQFKAPLKMTSANGANGEVWRITAVSEWKLKVQRISPTVSTATYAYFLKPFDNGSIAFTIDKVWLNYYLGEHPYEEPTQYYRDTYSSFDAVGFDLLEFEGPYDGTDFPTNVDLITEHGVTTDPVPFTHFALNVTTDDIVVGKIKLIVDSEEEEYYGFVLEDTPTFGTYIELRVEENGQLNPWVSPNFREAATITVIRQNEDDVIVIDLVDGSGVIPVSDEPTTSTPSS